MATGQTIREWIKAQIESVSGFNAVFEYWREIRRADQWTTDFGETSGGNPVLDSDDYQKTKGWTIQLINRPIEDEDMDGGAFDVYLARLRCVWSVYDRGASEVAFFNHVEDVANALSDDPTPAGIPNVYTVRPAQIVDSGYFQYPSEGGRLHHFAIVEQQIVIQRDVWD